MTWIVLLDIRVTSVLIQREIPWRKRGVATLVEGVQSSGVHEARFDGAKLPSGTYLYRLEADGQAQTGHLLLIK